MNFPLRIPDAFFFRPTTDEYLEYNDESVSTVSFDLIQARAGSNAVMLMYTKLDIHLDEYQRAQLKNDDEVDKKKPWKRDWEKTPPPPPPRRHKRFGGTCNNSDNVGDIFSVSLTRFSGRDLGFWLSYFLYRTRERVRYKE